MCRFTVAVNKAWGLYTRVNIIRSLNTINFESAETENVSLQFIYDHAMWVHKTLPIDSSIASKSGRTENINSENSWFWVLWHSLSLAKAK